jgi:ABC-type dipeptide/oligopeptide/nickel transport system permease component
VTTYIVQRILLAVLVVFGVSIITFFLTFLSGDPVVLMLPTDASSEQIARFRQDWGFDRPIIVQYGSFLWRALQGDLGTSLRHGTPALPLIAERLPATFQLTVTAMLLAVGLAIPLGVISATNRGKLIDLLTMAVALLGQALPNFWLAIMAILLFAVTLGWLPTSGRGTWLHLVLPAGVLATGLMALLTRITRSSMLEILSEDYVRTARAKGLPRWAVLSRHALRNALIPLVTVIGLQFGYILGGAVVVETVFTWPGVGLFTIQAITNRDYPVVQAAVLILSTAVVLINLVVDLLYGLLDPRIRIRG